MLKHPYIRQMVFVMHSKLVHLAAKGTDSPIFGELQIPSFETVEEALDYVRAAVCEAQ